MDVKTTRHTSTDLDALNEKIAQLLRDPSDAINSAAIDIDAMTLAEQKAFAELGGLGACVAKRDVLAETPDDLMYLSGERIIVLKHITKDIYLGYCEGVIGRFSAESVHFVELDPRVLESLDADLEFTTELDGANGHYRYSNSSAGSLVRGPHHDPDQPYYYPRNSTQSYSSGSDQYSSSIHEPHSVSHRGWPAKSSLDSLITSSSTQSRTAPAMRGRQQHTGRKVHGHASDVYYDGTQPMSETAISTHANAPPDFGEPDNFDTSLFNDDYSDESDNDPPNDSVYSNRITTPQKPLPTAPGMGSVRSTTGSVGYKSITNRAVRPTAGTNSSAKTPASTATLDVGKASQRGVTSNPTDQDHYSPMKSSQANASPMARNRQAPSTGVDEYGFIIGGNKAASSYTASHGYDMTPKSMKAYREREIKWLSIVGKLDAGTAKKDAKLKKLVRSGIPASVRARVWQFLAGSADYRKPGLYQNLCRRPPTKIYDVIERDIARCYPDHTQFKDEDGQGQQDLREILQAYSHYNTQLEYCQGMGRLAGCMLMHMPAEDAFWLLVATIDRYMNGYFTPTLSQLRIDAYIIGELLKEHEPKLAQHLEKNDILPIMYIAQWFLTAFTMTLPWSSVLRVWDVFYFEGVKVFYRISLAILEICKDHLIESCPTNSELLTFLLHIPHEYLTPETLLDTAFRIKLSKTDIKRYAKKASTSTDAMGLPVELGLKNLMAGSIHSNNSFSSLKEFGKSKLKGSAIKDSQSSSSVHDEYSY